MDGYQFTDHRLAIVTGAASGIGRATALLLAKRGANVLAIDLNEGGLESLVDEGPVNAINIVTADLTDPNCLDFITTITSEYTQPWRILVNNAGVGGARSLLNSNSKELARILNINLEAVLGLSRIALETMRRNGGGSIVNMSSIFALVGTPSSGVYSASKAALNGLTRQMAAEFGPVGIRVNSIAPGLINTPMTEARINQEGTFQQRMLQDTPLQRVGLPTDIAQAVGFLCSDEASFITGQVLAVDGGWGASRY